LLERARRLPFSSAKAKAILTDGSELQAVLPMLLDNFHLFLTANIDREMSQYTNQINHFGGVYKITAAVLTIQTWSSVMERRQEPCSEEDQEVYILAEKEGWKAVRLIAQVIKDWEWMGLAFSTTTGAKILIKHVPICCICISRHPTAENGGPADFTLDRKIEEMGWLIDGIAKLSWSWGDERLDQCRLWLRNERDLLVLESLLTPESSVSDSPPSAFNFPAGFDCFL